MILSRKGIDLEFYFFNFTSIRSTIDAIDPFLFYSHSISNSYVSVKRLLHFLIYKNALFK